MLAEDAVAAILSWIDFKTLSDVDYQPIIAKKSPKTL